MGQTSQQTVLLQSEGVCLCILQHVEDLGPGFKPVPQQWQHQTLNLLCHQGTPKGSLENTNMAISFPEHDMRGQWNQDPCPPAALPTPLSASPHPPSLRSSHRHCRFSSALPSRRSGGVWTAVTHTYTLGRTPSRQHGLDVAMQKQQLCRRMHCMLQRNAPPIYSADNAAESKDTAWNWALIKESTLKWFYVFPSKNLVCLCMWDLTLCSQCDFILLN